MHLSHRTPLIAVLFLLLASPLRAVAAADPSGHWEGKIQIPKNQVSITVDLAKSSTGVWTGSISVPVSSAIDVPLSDMTVEAAVVRFTASLPGKTSFEGTLATDASGLSGTVSNFHGAVPFQLTRNGEAHVNVPPPSTALPTNFEGAWEGMLDLGGKVMRIVLKLSPGAGGTATAMLINLDKGNQETPVSTVTVTGAQLELESRVVSGTYRGTLGPGSEIMGEWTQPGGRLPLIFRRPAAAESRKL
jgi:hypothetical protein